MSTITRKQKRRLDYASFTLCQMFCGWRLIFSLGEIADLGSGEIQINLLTGQSFFNDKPLAGLRIAEELHAWLIADLTPQQIAVANLSSAEIKAKLALAQIPYKIRQNKREVFLSGGETLQPKIMHRCRISVTAEIRAEGIAHLFSLDSQREWPAGWPSTAANT